MPAPNDRGKVNEHVAGVPVQTVLGSTVCGPPGGRDGATMYAVTGEPPSSRGGFQVTVNDLYVAAWEGVWAVVMLSDAATSCGTPGAGWALAGSSSPNVATPMRMRAGIPACQALPIAISALRFEQPFEPYVRVGNCGYEFTRSSRFVRRDFTIRLVVTSLAARARPAVLLRRRCTSCTRKSG